MLKKLASRISLAIVLSLLLAGPNSARAQASDVSDSVWSIVMPSAAGSDIDMGQVLVGESKDSVVVRFLENTGTVAIRIDSIFFLGSDSRRFSVVSGFPPFQIFQSASKDVEFRFSPTSEGVKTATIRVITQVDTMDYTIRGEGVLPRIEMLTSLVDFGGVLINTDKVLNGTAVIRNTGSDPLVISGTVQLGPDDIQFSVIAGGGAFTLASGESRTMDLRFAPTVLGRTSGRLGLYHDGPGSPAEVHLFGEGITAESCSATLAVDTIWASPGDAVEIAVRLKSSRNHSLTGATGFTADLRFNAALLSPVGTTPVGSVTNNERSIPIDDIPLFADQHGILKRLHFIATLGNVEGTPLYLENAAAVGGELAVSGIPGYFFLKDICREGGARLFDDGGRVQLRQNSPNPFNASTVIEYELIESGNTRVFVIDGLGREVAVLVDGLVSPGRYSAFFDASNLPSGTYHCILQTPTIRKSILMEVVK